MENLILLLLDITEHFYFVNQTADLKSETTEKNQRDIFINLEELIFFLKSDIFVLIWKERR